jgi:MFS family permease
VITTDLAVRAQHDLRRIFVVQGLRALGYGLGSVLLGAALAEGGLSSAQVGAVFTAMLAGMALGSLVVGRLADRIGSVGVAAMSCCWC